MTAAARTSEAFVRTPAQWRAVTSQPRLELLEALLSLGESTAAELAYALDRAPDSLYHHLRELTRAGLVELGQRHEPGRRPETTFAIPGNSLRFDWDPVSGHNAERLIKVGDVQLRRAGRYFADAVRAGGVVGEGPERNLRLWGDLVWLDDGERRRANEIFDELMALFERSRRRRHGTLYTYTLAMSPVARPRGTDDRTARRLSGTEEA